MLNAGGEPNSPLDAVVGAALVLLENNEVLLGVDGGSWNPGLASAVPVPVCFWLSFFSSDGFGANKLPA